MLASQLMVECGVPLVLVPCMSVASNLTVSAPELERHLQGTSRVGDYLTHIVTSQLTQEMGLNWLRLFHATYNKGLDDYGADGVPTTQTALAPRASSGTSRPSPISSTPRGAPSQVVPQARLTDDIRWDCTAPLGA